MYWFNLMLVESNAYDNFPLFSLQDCLLDKLDETKPEAAASAEEEVRINK
jgi:hypothetical protein